VAADRLQYRSWHSPERAGSEAGDLIATVPARDTLAVTGTGVDGGVAVLNHAVCEVWESPRGNRKLLFTPSLLTRQGTSWQLLES
jgi:hypothetical protein